VVGFVGVVVMLLTATATPMAIANAVTIINTQPL
jgi:hypothetical protein